MPTQSTKELLAAKETELVKEVFVWAKKYKLAKVVEQVRVNIKILERANTKDLAEADWEKIRARSLKWTSAERKFLTRLKRSGNDLCNLKDSPDPQKLIWVFLNGLNAYLIQTRLPYYLSSSYYNSAYRVSIKKRLAGPRGRQR